MNTTKTRKLLALFAVMSVTEEPLCAAVGDEVKSATSSQTNARPRLTNAGIRPPAPWRRRGFAAPRAGDGRVRCGQAPRTC